MGLIVLPVALILGTIWPELDSVAMSLIMLPLTLIFGSVFELELAAFFATTEPLRITLFTFIVPVFFLLAFLVLIWIHASEIGASGHADALDARVGHATVLHIHIKLSLLVV